MLPVLRLTTLMGDRDDDDGIRAHAIDDRVREARRQHVFAGSVLSDGITQRRLGDACKRGVDLVSERHGHERTALPVEA